MADDASAHPDVLNQAAQGQLKSIIERIERLELEKSEIAEQIKGGLRRGQGQRFRRQDPAQSGAHPQADRAKRLEEDAILDLYLSAIGEI